MFESGAVAPNGAIAGNDNDADALGVEPHYTEIRAADQVQIYESVMGDASGRPTTGLLTAVRYLKDNRLVPRGFDKSTADPWIAVVGAAAQDADFRRQRRSRSIRDRRQRRRMARSRSTPSCGFR